MPVLLDVEKLTKTEGPVDMSKGIPLELTSAQCAAVVMTKYISVNPMRADWQPDVEEGTFEQVTADIASGGRTPRITINGANGTVRRVMEDDSLIINLKGTMTRVVGIVAGQPPMSEEQIEAYIDQNEDAKVERFQQWDFRVASVLKTNGLESRMMLLKSEDQKRQQSQTDMFDAIREAFASLNLTAPKGVVEAAVTKATGGKV